MFAKKVDPFTYGSAEGHDALGDLGDVSPLVEVHRLEAVNVRDAVVLDGRLEFVDVLHHLELPALRVDLGNRAGLQLVHQPTEDGPVAEDLLEGARGQTLAEDCLNPAEHLRL